MEHMDGEGSKKAQLVETSPEGESRRGTIARAPYEAPRIVRRERIIASTLLSGQECVFDPPPC
jgi:hypothetical protein